MNAQVRCLIAIPLLVLFAPNRVTLSAEADPVSPAIRSEQIEADWARRDGMSDAELLASADKRIEKYRMADASVAVVDADGKPIPGARVKIEQTRHAFLFGCNIYQWGKIKDERLEAAYRKQFAELFNYATLAFYWPSYERAQGEPNHQYTRQLAQWCRQQGITTKGHPLAWNYSDPAWLPDDWKRIRTLQMARIDDCVSRFSGLIDIWDVVNEATHFERDSFQQKAPKMTRMWEQTGRVEFVRECFAHARKSNPKATLLINDYRTDPAYAALIEKLTDDSGRRIYDVIGIQSHMHGGAWSNRKIWDVCQRYAKFGVPLHFTETTIVSGGRVPASRRWGPSTPEGEARQAPEVARFYTMIFSHPATEALTWWDFSDRGAWQGAAAGFVRKDMTPKPAYLKLQRLIKDKWWTRATVTTDAKGRATFRGFLGEYRITVSADNRTPIVKTTTLGKDGNNRVEVALP